MTSWHVGLIGFGAIASDVLTYLRAGDATMRFTVLRRSDGACAAERVAHVGDLNGLLRAAPDLVVEAAGHQALIACAPALLEQGVPIVAASVGSLLQDYRGESLAYYLARVAERGGARLIVPPGAIGGLDYIASLARLSDVEIFYTSRKPPQAWRDELAQRGLAPGDVIDEILLFEGSVAEAAALYPKNLNVAATLALAAGEGTRIVVRVVVDAAARGNMHEIVCRSSAGSARFEFINAPSPGNPKTSMTTALSIAHCVEDYLRSKALRRAS